MNFFFGDQIFIGKMINDCKKTPNRIRRIPDPIHPINEEVKAKCAKLGDG